MLSKKCRVGVDFLKENLKKCDEQMKRKERKERSKSLLCSPSFGLGCLFLGTFVWLRAFGDPRILESGVLHSIYLPKFMG